MSDGVKTAVGITGTTVSFIMGQITLYDWSLIAATVAGFATAIWMAFQIAHRIREIILKRGR